MKKIFTFTFACAAIFIYLIHVKIVGILPVDTNMIADAATIAAGTGLTAGIAFLFRKMFRK